MFFKNARIYRITKPMAMTAEWLEEQLQGDAFKPCGPQEVSRQGWVPPLGKHGEQLVHSAGGYHLIALRREEKLLPPSVINELVEDRVETIEAEQLRKVRRKERDEIKEQVTLEMLPRAFSKNRRCFAYLAPKDGLLVVDASSAKQAEELASFLRKSLGSLPVRPPAVEQAPAFTLTGWLSESIDLPEVVTLGDACELKDPSEDGGVVRCKGLDLQGDEIRSHLDAGMQVTKLAITWENNLSFTLDEELAIRQLKFGDTLQEKLDDVEADDAVARFDAAFSLMTLELSRLFPALLEALGGEDRTAIVEGEPVTVGVDMEGGSDRTVTASVLPQPELEDWLYGEAVSFVATSRRVSTSSIQRKFKIGFNRAANLIDEMERNGVVSKAGHNGAREVLAPKPAAATA